MDKSKNIDWVDLAKGISILLVVYHHVIQSTYQIPFQLEGELVGLFNEFYKSISLKLVPLRMPLFFLLSGFLVRKYIINLKFSDVVYKRIYSILYIYILWNVLHLLLVFFLEANFGSVSHNHGFMALYAISLKDFLFRLGLGISSVWYLYALVLYFVLCRILSFSPAICLLLFALVSVVSISFEISFPFSSMARNGFFYAFGCFAFPVIVHHLKPGMTFLLCTTIAFLLVKLSLGFINIEVYLTDAIILVGLMILLINFISYKFSFTYIRWVGKNTLQIYLLHFVVLKVFVYCFMPSVESLLTSYEQLISVWYIIYPPMMTVLAAVLSILIWRISSFSYGRFLYKAPRLQGSFG